MKHLILFTAILALSISSCSPATLSPEPTNTSTYIPSPTVTVTPTPTITPSPTPDPMQVVADQLGKEGINVDTTTGKLTFKGSEVPNTTFDATGLHIQIGDKTFDFPQADILNRIAVKEGSVVIFDKDQALYNNPDMSQWPEVVAAFNPNAQTEKWQGWKEKADVIAVDKEHPIDAGNTWNEYFDFVANEKAFLQPFPPGTYRLTPKDKYYDGPNGIPRPPFEPFDAWSKPDFINPIRPGQNLWVVGANTDEGRPWDTIGTTEQVFSQIFDLANTPYVGGIQQTIQSFHFTSTDNNQEITRSLFFTQATADTNDVVFLPMLNINGHFGGGTRMLNMNEYAQKFGYLDGNGNSTGKIEDEVNTFMSIGKIPEDLQNAWSGNAEIWYHSLGF